MKTIGFIGLGLIGVSIAKTIRKFHPDYHILAYAKHKETLATALSCNAIDAVLEEKDERYRTCDYIFLCAPVEYNIEYLKYLKNVISDDCIITDAGSVKGPIHKAVEELGMDHCFIGGHPMGAVKEQSANLYATKMAERGFVTLSIDLSFWGASEGEPRNAVLPEVYAEDFSAAVDFLGTRPFVDRNNIGVIGICGSGSFAISAAKIEPRLKAIATISMYNMGTASRNGLKHALTLEQRKQIMAEAAEQRYAEFLGGETKYTGGTVHEVTENSGPIEREFYEFYRTQRGEFTPEGATPMTTTHPTLSSNVKFMNFYPFADIETISPRPMLFITGENAHSREFSEDAYRLAAEPKELYIVPGAGHVDLYDRVGLIPFDKLESFFKEYLKK